MNEHNNPLFAVQRRSGNRAETVYWKLNSVEGTNSEVFQPNEADKLAIAEAATMLREGGTVAFTTETVYGLGADARNTSAVEAVFAAKGRPSDNPLIVHIADTAALDELVAEMHPKAAALMAAYWPGPLTVVLPVREGVLSPCVTAGLDTVGVRMPDHPVALALISAAGCPVAAPSANRSGRPSPTLASHVMEDLAGYIDGVLDGGAAGVGLESTVVQVQPDGKVAVLRPGGITSEQLAAVVGAEAVSSEPGNAEATAASTATVVSDSEAVKTPVARSETAKSAAGFSTAGDSSAPRAPGMKYTHHSAARLAWCSARLFPQRVADEAASQLQAAQLNGEITGLLLLRSIRPFIPPILPPAFFPSARYPRRRKGLAPYMPLCGVSMKRERLTS